MDLEMSGADKRAGDANWVEMHLRSYLDEVCEISLMSAPGKGSAKRFTRAQEKSIVSMRDHMMAVKRELEKLRINATLQLFMMGEEELHLAIFLNEKQMSKFNDRTPHQYREDGSARTMLIHRSSMNAVTLGGFLATGCPWIPGGGAAKSWTVPADGQMPDAMLRQIMARQGQSILAKGLEESLDRHDTCFNAKLIGANPQRFGGLMDDSSYGGATFICKLTVDGSATTSPYKNNTDFFNQLTKGQNYGAGGDYNSMPSTGLFRYRLNKQEQVQALTHQVMTAAVTLPVDQASLRQLLVGLRAGYGRLNADLNRNDDTSAFAV
jgi:hypothetical protein